MTHGMPHRFTYRVYGTAASGNCHKVKMALDILHLGYRWHEVDMMGGATRTPEFLAMNPNGRVPLLQIDTHQFLPESNAILAFLADSTHLWPGDRWQRAQVLQWMFFEQYSHEPYVAVVRFIRRFTRNNDDPRLPALEQRGYAALAVMEQHLRARPFFVGSALTIADLALFAYTCVAGGAGFDLARYPSVTAWLDRCRAVPGVIDTPEP